MDTTNYRLVVGTSDRAVHVWDLRNPGEPEQRRKSALKFQTRCIRCFPDSSGETRTGACGPRVTGWTGGPREGGSGDGQSVRSTDGPTDWVRTHAAATCACEGRVPFRGSVDPHGGELLLAQ